MKENIPDNGIFGKQKKAICGKLAEMQKKRDIRKRREKMKEYDKVRLSI